jgi:hypothetical protein
MPGNRGSGLGEPSAPRRRLGASAARPRYSPQSRPFSCQRRLKHRPEGAIRTVPIPPQLARLLRWHLQTFGCAADGRLFQGARGGPLSENLYGRIWHQARAAAMPQDGTGTQPARRPYDLRHAALSLWLASGAPPAEIAARAGHSVRVLLTIYAHGIPGCDQIASQHIEQALRPSPWPPLAHKNPPSRRESRPSCVRHSWTQRDTAGPETSTQIRLHACDLRNYRPMRPVPWIAAPDRRSRAPVPHAPLTRPDLADNWPTATGNGLPNCPRDTHQTRSPGTPAPGLTWAFVWQVLGSTLRRLSRRFYRRLPFAGTATADLRIHRQQCRLRRGVPSRFRAAAPCPRMCADLQLGNASHAQEPADGRVESLRPQDKVPARNQMSSRIVHRDHIATRNRTLRDPAHSQSGWQVQGN